VAAGKRIPSDMKYFKEITSGTIDPNKINAALMGRRTWLGIPEKFRPLTGRLNIVLSNDSEWMKTLPKEVLSAKNLAEAINLIDSNPELCLKVESMMIVGGVQLFEESLFHPLCDSYHVTCIDTEFPCDTYLTQATIEKLKSLQPASVSENHTENGLNFRYYTMLT